MPGHHHECHVRSIVWPCKKRVKQMHHSHQQRHRVSTYSHMHWSVWVVWVSGGEEKIEESVLVWAALALTLT